MCRNVCDTVVCCTYVIQEKWDSMSRRWKDNRQLFQGIRLLCIDEVGAPTTHIQHDNVLHNV
jgi:hypothetical protein